MSDKVFLDIVNMSITGSFAILIIMLARLLLKKAPKVFSYALWFVAFFRLLVPVSFESILSIYRSTQRYFLRICFTLKPLMWKRA